jgi:hypothetical protein
MQAEHWKQQPEQLVLFDMPAAVSLIGLHRFIRPLDNTPAFFNPRLFNPNKPIDTHDDAFDSLAEVIELYPQVPRLAA